MYATPAIITTIPGPKNEKKRNGSCPASRSASLTSMLGGVLISVRLLPRCAANASGRKSRAGAIPRRCAIVPTTGRRIATVPVELMNAESSAATTITAIVTRASPSPAPASSRSPSQSATPVPESAAPTTKSPAIISIAGLEKPASASGSDTTPEHASASSDIIATTSSRSRSLMKSAIVAARIRAVMSASDTTAALLSRSPRGASRLAAHRYAAAVSLPRCGSAGTTLSWLARADRRILSPLGVPRERGDSATAAQRRRGDRIRAISRSWGRSSGRRRAAGSARSDR